MTIDWCTTHKAQAFGPVRCVLIGTVGDCEIVEARIWPIVDEDEKTP